MNAIEEIINEFEDMCGESGTEIGNNARKFLQAVEDVLRCRRENHPLALEKCLDKLQKMVGDK